MTILKVDSPYSGEIVAEVPLISSADLPAVVSQGRAAQRELASWSLEQRTALCRRFLAEVEKRSESLAGDITDQMGKPLAESRGEVRGLLERARTMMSFAPEALAEEVLPPKEGFIRKIVREPVGLVLVIAAWNYPLLIAVNGVVPAVLAGNAVLLKHSGRTPLCGEAFAEAFAAAGAPKDLVQALHCSHAVTADLVADPGVDYVAFTGSVGGGRAVHRAAGGRYIQVATELGGKDPAYVRADADLSFTVPNLVEGACYNAGQSCCAIERIYVHEHVYDEVVERAVEAARGLVLGDPRVAATTIGPMAQSNQLAFLTAQVADARQRGARVLLGGESTQVSGRGRFFQPTVIADTDHAMDVMMEESFGPIVALSRVTGDEQALVRMNDSAYGLTASIWTQDSAFC